MTKPPDPWPRLVGASPLWLGVYAHVNAKHARFTLRQTASYRRRKRGWPVKVLWVTTRTHTQPITLSIRRLASRRRAWIRITGLYTKLSRAPVLDPSRPSHPDDPSRPDTHEWGSSVLFARAGCYRFAAAWAGGEESFVFGFGRPR